MDTLAHRVVSGHELLLREFTLNFYGQIVRVTDLPVGRGLFSRSKKSTIYHVNGNACEVYTGNGLSLTQVALELEIEKLAKIEHHSPRYMGHLLKHLRERKDLGPNLEQLVNSE